MGAAGLTLADLLRHDARAESEARRPKSVIYIVLSGGPSHIDSWDLKPDAPDDFRGPFRPIATRLPGVRFCEHMPLQAGDDERLALVRGVRSVENDHFLSEVYTGLPRASGRRPAFGSVVSRLEDGDSPLPTYVSLSEPTSDQFEFEKPFYAGAGHAPYRPFGDALKDLSPVKDLDQLQDRRRLMTAFDSVRRDIDRGDGLAGLDRFQAQALEMITSPKVRDAFDLSREPASLLSAYGHKAGKYPHQTVKTILYDWDARPFLLARRLVEAGVPRGDAAGRRVGPPRQRPGRHLRRPQDEAVAAGPEPYRPSHRPEGRGLDKDVLVVVLGEFGRTPKITRMGPGREHWAEAGLRAVLRRRAEDGPGDRRDRLAGRAFPERHDQLPEHPGDDLPRPRRRSDPAADRLQRPAAVLARRPRTDRRFGRMKKYRTAHLRLPMQHEPHLFASPSSAFPTRRSFLRRAGNGFGLLALADLLGQQGLLAAERRSRPQSAGAASRRTSPPRPSRSSGCS